MLYYGAKDHDKFGLYCRGSTAAWKGCKLDLTKIRVLDKDLMKGMLSCIEEMSIEERQDSLRRTLGLIRFLEERIPDAKESERGNLLVAFQFRLEALTRLREEPAYHYWALRIGKKGETDCIDEVLVETAAVEPLIVRDQLPAFEARTFFQKVLQLCQAEGNA